MPTTTSPTPPTAHKRGMIATLVRTVLFHVFAALNGLLLVALLVLTAGGVGLMLLCTVSASTRSSRLFVAWLWRNELWINGLVGDKQTEPERLEQERARGLRREASQQGGRMTTASSLPTTTNSTASSASLSRSSSTRGREVTKTVMTFSVLYFLLFKGFFNVIFATVPLTLWAVVVIHVAPSLAPEGALMVDGTMDRVFVALATSFFAYQIGVAAATMSVYVSEKVQELLFHRDVRRSSERTPLFENDVFLHRQTYSDPPSMSYRSMYSIDERAELLRDHDASGTNGPGSSSTSPPPPPPPPPPPLPHGQGFPYDGFRPTGPIPPMPPMVGDPRRPGPAYESAFRAEPVTREMDFCGVKVTVQTQPDENNRAHGHGGGRGSGSFRGIGHRGGGRGGGGMGRGGFYHHGMPSGAMEPPMAYGVASPPFGSSEPVPEVFARIVTEDDQARQSSNRAPPMASPVFGRSCSSSPRGHRRRGGRKGNMRYGRSDSFDSGQPSGVRFAPDVDLKHGAHTRLWEALDLRPSAPNLPDAYPVARPSSQYPLSPRIHSSRVHKTQSDNGYRSDFGYTDDSDTPSGFRKFDLFATKQKLKEESRLLKVAAKRLKREYKEQIKRDTLARVGEHERFAADQQRYADEQVRSAREYAKEEERRAKEFARSARALGQRKQTDMQLKQAEIQRKQAEDQRKQVEDQRKQAEEQRKQALEARAARPVEQHLKFKASPTSAGEEPKHDAPRVEELSASYRERVQEIQTRDEFAIEIERAAAEEVERQRRELEAAGQPQETKLFTASRVMSSDSGREGGRLRGRRPTNSSDFLVGVSSTGVNDPDFVSRPRRHSSSRVINFANPFQTGTDFLDTDIQAAYGSTSRSDDDVMGINVFGGMSSSTSSPTFLRGLDTSPLYRAMTEGYDQLSPHTSPTNSFMTNSFVDTQYDQLSPTHSLHDADFPSEEFQQVYRSIRYTDENRVVPSQLSALPHYEDVPGQRDKVHFCSYAPPSVYPSKQSFRFSVWAFLLNQRHEMRERAEAADPDAQLLSVNTKMIVRRGAIVHVTLEAPTGFKILNGATQGFPWDGKISNVGYDIECTEHADFGQVLFKASIVVGTEVAVLRSYVIVSSRKLEPSELEAKLLDSELEVLEMTYNEVPYPSLELKEFVGSGYFGDAYRASYNGEDVVVKTIRASEFGETNDQIIKEFQHEAAVLSMFGHHPCVVPFVGASTDTRYPLSLITKYLPFGSLEDNLKKPEMNNTLTTRQRTAMLKDAAAGLLNIHEGGFIHRDVAARNCLVDSNLRVKICDFGLCRRVNAYGGSLMKDSVGPIKYMAPESLQPPHSFSYESDAWMFGVLMWETYTATPPFQSKTPIQAGMAVLQGERLPVPTDLPEDLQELMEACFHEVPSERPSMAQILEELDRATAPRPLGQKRSPMASGHAMASAATGSNGHAPPRGLGRHDMPIQV